MSVTYFHINKPVIPSSNTVPKMIPGMNAACISVRQVYKIQENFITFYDEILCIIYKLIVIRFIGLLYLRCTLSAILKVTVLSGWNSYM